MNHACACEYVVLFHHICFDLFTKNEHYWPPMDLVRNGAYGFGLDFRVCNYVRASTTIYRICMDRFYSYLVQRQHMMVYICTSLFVSTSDPRWPTGGHFSCKKHNLMSNVFSSISRTCIYRCCSNLACR